MTSVLVGIAGGSASGKTTLAKRIQQALYPKEVSVLSLDSYYFCNKHLPPEERAQVNYDHPNAFDIRTLVADLHALLEGAIVEVPKYDFTTHSRSRETVTFSAGEFLIVEGILTLHFPELRALFSRKIFLDVSSEARFKRRLSRDVQERGRTSLSVCEQWKSLTLPMHEQYCEQTKKYADLVLSSIEDISTIIRYILHEE